MLTTQSVALLASLVATMCAASAQTSGSVDPRTGMPTKQARRDAFRQLDQELPTPTPYRTGSGAPGHAYWQQQADYVIDVALDETTRRMTARERVTYHNHSPDHLDYLWLQLDLNLLRPSADGHVATSTDSMESFSEEALGRNRLRSSCSQR